MRRKAAVSSTSTRFIAIRPTTTVPGSRASKRSASVFAVGIVLVGTAVVSAHRQDEYLQAARVAIEPGAVQIELDLTPGIALADAIVADIDRNRDGSFAHDEQIAYGNEVLGALVVEADE